MFMKSETVGNRSEGVYRVEAKGSALRPILMRELTNCFCKGTLVSARERDEQYYANGGFLSPDATEPSASAVSVQDLFRSVRE